MSMFLVRSRAHLLGRGVDVRTAQEDGTAELPDDLLLDRATALNRALFTRDGDLLAEAKKRQQAGRFFAGVIYAHQLRVIGSLCERWRAGGLSQPRVAFAS